MDRDSKEMWKLAAEYGAVGFEIAIAITLGYLIGDYLDGAWGTGPYLTVAFLIFGFGAAVKAIVRIIRKVKLDEL